MNVLTNLWLVVRWVSSSPLLYLPVVGVGGWHQATRRKETRR